MKQAVTNVAARVAVILKVIWSFLVQLPFVGKKVRWLGNLSKEVSVAFFILEEVQDTEEVAVRVANTVAKRLFYFFADWGLALASWSMVGGIKLLGYPFLYGLAAMWVFDVIVATVFVYIYKKHGEDVTLAVNFRRGVEAVFRRSRIAGSLAVTGVIIKAVYWDGPEHIVIFFEKELKNIFGMMTALVMLTVVQAIIWTAIIYLGLESIEELIRFIWNLVM